jgi:hypothetical protein
MSLFQMWLPYSYTTHVVSVGFLRILVIELQLTKLGCSAGLPKMRRTLVMRDLKIRREVDETPLFSAITHQCFGTIYRSHSDPWRWVR